MENESFSPKPGIRYGALIRKRNNRRPWPVGSFSTIENVSNLRFQGKNSSGVSLCRESTLLLKQLLGSEIIWRNCLLLHNQLRFNQVWNKVPADLWSSHHGCRAERLFLYQGQWFHRNRGWYLAGEAMINVVHPLRRMLLSMIFSVFGIQCTVASSITRMVGLTTNARAISTRCLWPPLRLPAGINKNAVITRPAGMRWHHECRNPESPG